MSSRDTVQNKKQQINDLLYSEGFRSRVQAIITEQTDSVSFMEKVQKYADIQIDRRSLKNYKVIAKWIVKVLISVIIAKLTL